MWRISFIILLFTHICTFAPAHAGAQVHNGETQYLSRPLSGSKSSPSKKQGGLNLRLHSSAPRTSLFLSPMKRKLEWEATCNHVDSLVANGEMRPNEWLNLYFKILSDTVALGFDTQPMLERIALNYDSLMQSNPPQLTDDLNFAAYKTGVKNTFGMIRPSSILFEMASRRYCEDIDLDLTINPSLMKELLHKLSVSMASTPGLFCKVYMLIS